MEKSKRVHYTFRIDEDNLSTITDTAKKEGIPTSSLINKIIQNYLKKNRFFDELGFIPIGKNTLKIWFDNIGVDELKEQAIESGPIIGREYIVYFFDEVNAHTLIKFLNVWFSIYGVVHQTVHENTYSFTVHHDINENFSNYLGDFLKSLIESITGKKMEFQAAPRLLSFKFDI